MTESEKRTHRVCFTGHRPEKLTRNEKAIKKDLETKIIQAIADGLHVFITGMARGVDIWAAQIVLSLRDKGYPIKLMCACPYDGFEKEWDQMWQIQYQAIPVSYTHLIMAITGIQASIISTMWIGTRHMM